MKKYFVALEILAAALILLSICGFQLPSALTVIVLMACAVFYYIAVMPYFKFGLLNKIVGEFSIKKLVKIFSPFVLSLFTIGLLFKIQHYPGSKIMLTFALPMGVATFAANLIFYLKERNIPQPPVNENVKPKFSDNLKFSYSEMALRLGIAIFLSVIILTVKTL